MGSDVKAVCWCVKLTMLQLQAYRVSAVQHISAYLVSESEGHHADLDTLKQLAANIFKQYLSDKVRPRFVLLCT